MKELTVIFLSSWKFAAIFPVTVMVFNFSWAKTLLFTNIGGVIGIVIFGLFSKLLIGLWVRYWPDKLKVKRKNRKIHTKRNRRIVLIKKKYGLAGIVILSPVLLSIPVGSFLITKYYGRNKVNYLWQMAGQIAWSLIYTAFYTYLQNTI